MKELAIYGKGGIGKSTLSANISAALAMEQKRILQIGCDPKHDSTRLLMHGRRITTVLDYIKHTGAVDYRLQDILFTGYENIGCIEAGGPEPGVGCAGRGIITAFELLEKFHIKEQYDLILYDVLGDVVCGGFAVPIRREYADTIFLVTSGEYMSIYAANNILRGIRNYDQDRCRVAGILYNSRNVKNEDQRVEAFAQATGLPIFAKIPRDDTFAAAEKAGCTVMELQQETGGRISEIFRSIAKKILALPRLYPARPLTDENLEELIFYGKSQSPRQTAAALPKAAPKPEEPAYDAGYLSKNVLRDEPLHGCAFNGAMNMSSQLRDVAVVAHSPKSCTYMSYQSISSSGRRQLFERGALLPVSLVPNLTATDMDESDMVFGGTDKLLDAVRRVRAMEPRPKAVVVISSCPAGIIGDDIDKAKALSTPDCPVVTIKTEGNLTGDYLQGMLMAYTQLARQIIDPTVKPQPKVVNVIFEKVVAKNTQRNFEVMRDLLATMGIRVNCRFLCNTSLDSLKNFQSASLNLLANKDYTGTLLRDFFVREYGSPFYDGQFPTGFAETSQWLRDLGAWCGEPETAEALITQHQAEYDRRIAAVRSTLRGKRLMIITYNHELDWILRAAIDAGMEIVKLCILNFSQDEGFRTKLPEVSAIPVEENYDRTKRTRDLQACRPDILLSNYESNLFSDDCVLDTIPMCPDNGFFSGLLMVERWKDLFQTMNQGGEWRHDKSLFDKYYPR